MRITTLCNGLFDTFTGEDYQQKLYSNVGELVTQVKPTYEMASSEEIGAILEAGNRTAAGPTVPPGGLYMTHLWYDDGIEKFECGSDWTE